MPNPNWLDKYSTELTILSLDDLRAALKRISVPPRGLLRDFTLRVVWYTQGDYVVQGQKLPYVDTGTTGPIENTWPALALPTSERELMRRIYFHIKAFFVHEFEEHFEVDGVKVLEPHNSALHEKLINDRTIGPDYVCQEYTPCATS